MECAMSPDSQITNCGYQWTLQVCMSCMGCDNNVFCKSETLLVLSMVV